MARSFLATVRWFIARATPDGARTLVWPSTAGVAGHGKYSLDCEFSESVSYLVVALKRRANDFCVQESC